MQNLSLQLLVALDALNYFIWTSSWIKSWFINKVNLIDFGVALQASEVYSGMNIEYI